MTAPTRAVPRFARRPLRKRDRERGSAVGRWWGPVNAVIVVVAFAVGLLAGFRVSLILVSALAALHLIVGLRRPAFGLLGATMLCVIDAPARVYLFTGGVLPWNSFHYWLLLAMVLYVPFFIRLRDVHSVLLALFSVVLLIDLVMSADLAEGMQNILAVVTAFGLLTYFVRVMRNGDDRRLWFWLGTIAGLIGALGSLVWFLQRLTLPRINENAWATFPATALFVICLGYRSATELRRGQGWLMALAGANLGWIFLSGSRGNLLIGTCAMILLLVTMRGLRQRTISVIAGVLIALTVTAHFSTLQERTVFRIVKLFTTSEPLAGDYSLSSRTSGRSDLAMGGWLIFTNHPLGVGTGGFQNAWYNIDPRVLDKFTDIGSYARDERAPAHSGWIKTLAENGFPGTLVLLAFVASFGIVGLRTRDRFLRRLGILTSVTLAAALLSTEFQGEGLWYLAMGTAALLQRRRMLAAMFRPDVLSATGPSYDEDEAAGTLAAT